MRATIAYTGARILLFAAALGLIWIAGRALHFAGYSKAAEKRLPGFFVQSTACLLLFVGAIVGLVMHTGR